MGEIFEEEMLNILLLQLNHWCQTCLVSRQVTKPHPKRRDGPWERPSISKSSYDTILVSVYQQSISGRYYMTIDLAKKGQLWYMHGSLFMAQPSSAFKVTTLLLYFEF